MVYFAFVAGKDSFVSDDGMEVKRAIEKFCAQKGVKGFYSVFALEGPTSLEEAVAATNLVLTNHPLPKHIQYVRVSL